MKKINVDKCLVLNLEEHTYRKLHIMDLFSKLNIDYEFFTGIDGRKLDLKNLPYGLTLNANLTRGRIGCFCSHYAIWKKIVENNWNKTLIFEDDVIVDDISDEIIDEINSYDDYDILYLSFFDECAHTKVPITNYIYTYHSDIIKGPYNFNTYIITLNCAKILLEKLSNITSTIDGQLFDIEDYYPNIKVVYPMLFRQSRQHSWVFSTTCEWR